MTELRRVPRAAAAGEPDAELRAALAEPIRDWRLPGRLTAADGAEAEVRGGWSQTRRYNRPAVVEWVRPLTSTGTVHIGLRTDDGEPFEFVPGQFIGVEHHVEGIGYARSPYCIFSPPTDDGRFELLVRVVRNGPVSRYLGSCVPGERIDFRAPTGHSMIPKDDDRHLVLMATGVGVSPFHSLARVLLEGGWERDITLYWGLRLADDICLVEEFAELAARHPNFSWHVTLSQPPAGWTGLRGRITESVPPLLTTLGGTRYELCGNGAMCEDMAAALSDQGVADDYVYVEHFFNKRHVPSRAVLDEISARFVASDLFSPLAHQGALPSLFHLDSPLGGRKGNADPTAPTDVGRRMPKVVERVRSAKD
ncbi:MAG TPA: FAD-dependent oxidoreductase [Acidimicrobiales bacterium]|nr:FAD-dependent oxidoreductase [Acidimicrobiales bacterium]